MGHFECRCLCHGTNEACRSESVKKELFKVIHGLFTARGAIGVPGPAMRRPRSRMLPSEASCQYDSLRRARSDAPYLPEPVGLDLGSFSRTNVRAFAEMN